MGTLNASEALDKNDSGSYEKKTLSFLAMMSEVKVDPLRLKVTISVFS